MVKAEVGRGRFRLPSLGFGPQVVGFILVLGLLAAMAIQPTRQLLAQKQRIDQMSEDLSQVHNVNARLSDRIARLRDPDYIEQRARAQGGFVRPGETTFLVVPTSGKKPDHKKAPAVTNAPPAPPEPPTGFEGFLHFLGVL